MRETAHLIRVVTSAMEITMRCFIRLSRVIVRLNLWRMGLVTAVHEHPSDDGLVRKVTLRKGAAAGSVGGRTIDRAACDIVVLVPADSDQQ